MSRFMKISFDNPTLTQKQTPHQLGYSVSTNKRYTDQLSMSIPYNKKIPKGKI